jgi:tRNA(Ile)-lysidine synthase
MLSSILRAARTHHLFERGDRVLLGVSGGPDSMALMHALWELADRLGISLEVATVDHGLRPEAAREAALVGERASALELPWHLLRVDVAAARRRERASLQDAARRLRLAALGDLAARLGAARIALGHQADDQAETVLFRIVRGTGLGGLGGIPYARPLRAGASVLLVHPLLDVRRGEVLRYLRRRSIPFVDDPSNADLRFARARVRHRLLPALAAENPRVAEALVALAAAARAASSPDAGGPRAPSASAGAELPADVGRRARAVIARLRAARGGSRKVDLAGGRVAEIAYGQVVVVGGQDARAAGVANAARGPGPPGPPPPGPSLAIAGPGVYAWPGSAGLAVTAVAPPASAVAACFDADAVAWPLQVRVRRPGDRMRPRGGRGTRKLSDLLIDAKISRNERERLPVVTTADGVVLFVPGLRPAEEGRPTPATTRLVRLALANGSAESR